MRRPERARVHATAFDSRLPVASCRFTADRDLHPRHAPAGVASAFGERMSQSARAAPARPTSGRPGGVETRGAYSAEIDRDGTSCLEARRVLEQCSSALTCHGTLHPVSAPSAASLASVRNLSGHERPPGRPRRSRCRPARAHRELDLRARAARAERRSQRAAGRRRRRRRNRRGCSRRCRHALHDGCDKRLPEGNQMVSASGSALPDRRAKRDTAASLRWTRFRAPQRVGASAECVLAQDAPDRARAARVPVDAELLGESSRVAGR